MDDDNNLPGRYFGPEDRRKEWERRIPTPVGETCLLCAEPIAEGDCGTINFVDQVTHYECEMRLAVGSVGHLMGRCYCKGGTEEDPPGMTIREASIAACNLWEAMQKVKH